MVDIEALLANPPQPLTQTERRFSARQPPQLGPRPHQPHALGHRHHAVHRPGRQPQHTTPQQPFHGTAPRRLDLSSSTPPRHVHQPSTLNLTNSTLSLLIGRHRHQLGPPPLRTLTQPVGQELLVPGEQVHLLLALHQRRQVVTVHGDTHPVALLMQHTIRDIHPQTRPRPRTTTTNKLSLAHTTQGGEEVTGMIHPLTSAVPDHPQIIAFGFPKAVNLNLNTLTTLLSQPHPHHLLSTSERLIRTQITRTHHTLPTRIPPLRA